jgi:hypothetical protein
VIPRRVVYRERPAGGSHAPMALFGLAIASALLALVGILPAVNASIANGKARAAKEEYDALVRAYIRTESGLVDWEDKRIVAADARIYQAKHDVEVFEKRSAETFPLIVIGLGGAVALTLGAIFLKMK